MEMANSKIKHLIARLTAPLYCGVLSLPKHEVSRAIKCFIFKGKLYDQS